MLLSRVADNLFWSARHLERAADTARMVWGYTEGIVDLPRSVNTSWVPLLAITGSREPFEARYGTETGEQSIVSFLIADRDNPGSVASSIEIGRENLRPCRDVIPQFAWAVVNDLHLYLGSHPREGIARPTRNRFIERVRRDVERVEGIVSTTMIRDAAYDFWCLGQLVERADMTTRVLGVQAAELLNGGHEQAHKEVQWMTVLRSVSGRQMYQRATHQPINGPAVVEFLVHHPAFPRSVKFCVDAIEEHVNRLPRAGAVQRSITRVRDELETPLVDSDDGAALDASMDRIQIALTNLSRTISATYGYLSA